MRSEEAIYSDNKDGLMFQFGSSGHVLIKIRVIYNYLGHGSSTLLFFVLSAAGLLT